MKATPFGEHRAGSGTWACNDTETISFVKEASCIISTYPLADPGGGGAFRAMAPQRHKVVYLAPKRLIKRKNQS